MTTYSEALIEVLAATSDHGREDGPSAACPSCRAHAERIIDALAAAGYRIVPDPFGIIALVDDPEFRAGIEGLADRITRSLRRHQLTDEEKAAVAAPPLVPEPPNVIVALHPADDPVGDYHARMQALRAARDELRRRGPDQDRRHELDALQEAPDTETDPTPPHGTPRPCWCLCHKHGAPHTMNSRGCCPDAVHSR